MFYMPTTLGTKGKAHYIEFFSKDDEEEEEEEEEKLAAQEEGWQTT